MDIFAQNKLLLRVIFALVVLNIVALGGIWLLNSQNTSQGRKEAQAEKVMEILKEKLELTSEQVEKFQKIRSRFFDKERVLAATIRAGRDSMNTLMFNQFTDSVLVRTIARRVADNEFSMELLRIEQADELKRVCTPSQLQRFESMMHEIRDYLKPVKP